MELLLRYKKIFIITGFLIVVLALGYGIFFLFFQPMITGPAPTEPGAATTTAGLPTAATGTGQIVPPLERQPLPGEEIKSGDFPSPVAQGSLTAVTELNKTASLDAVLAGNGSAVQYYNLSDGKFYRIDQNGSATPLNDKVFHGVSQVYWNTDKNSAILEYPDGANIYYDFSSNKQVTLPKHWQDFDFSPDGNQVVMKSLGLDVDNRWLAISSPDGSKVKAIEPLGENEETVYTAWSPNSQIVAMYTEGKDFNRQEVYFVGQNKENFKSTVVEGRGFQPKWSPTQGRLLYSVYSSQTDMKPMLWIVNATGEEIGTGRRNLGVETWAEKCVFFSDSELYCAVPDQLEAGAGLFPEMARASRDNLYKIDPVSGLKQLIAVPDGSYNMSNLIVSADGYYLYFTDETTKRLHKINLK
ncbi:MAG: hypothetical protein MUC28_01745 [Planctomycetes bacterium]|jgi:hypothetical protein|nr:hypothetical protein [Planctomycetota bacterium]